MIIFLFCSSKSPAYDSEGAELDTFGTQERIEYNFKCCGSLSWLNSGEKIGKLVYVICFSWIFNFISLIFFSQSLFDISVYKLMIIISVNRYAMNLVAFLILSSRFKAFTVFEFITGILFSSL